MTLKTDKLGRFLPTDYSYLVGTVIDDMTVLKAEHYIAHVKCNICGKEKDMQIGHILHHVGTKHKTSCFMNIPDRWNYLVNTDVDDLHVDCVKKEVRYKNCNPMWYAYCKCNVCGHEKITTPERLLTHVGTQHSYCNRGKYPYRFVDTFTAIHDRLTDKSSSAYKRYGARGIKCEWKDLDEFARDMLESYLESVELFGELNTSIERIDVDGNYCKDNCLWIDLKDQASNTRRTIYYHLKGPDGKEYIGRNLLKFCREHGINSPDCRKMLHGRLHICHGYTGHLLTKEQYKEYWRSQPIPADMDEVWKAFKFCYDKCSILDRYQTDRGTRIPLNMLNSAFCMFVPPEAVRALCELPNEWNLDIDYDEEKKFFYVTKTK